MHMLIHKKGILGITSGNPLAFMSLPLFVTCNIQRLILFRVVGYGAASTGVSTGVINDIACWTMLSS